MGFFIRHHIEFKSWNLNVRGLISPVKFCRYSPALPEVTLYTIVRKCGPGLNENWSIVYNDMLPAIGEQTLNFAKVVIHLCVILTWCSWSTIK